MWGKWPSAHSLYSEMLTDSFLSLLVVHNDYACFTQFYPIPHETHLLMENNLEPKKSAIFCNFSGISARDTIAPWTMAYTFNSSSIASFMDISDDIPFPSAPRESWNRCMKCFCAHVLFLLCKIYVTQPEEYTRQVKQEKVAHVDHLTEELYCASW